MTLQLSLACVLLGVFVFASMAPAEDQPTTAPAATQPAASVLDFTVKNNAGEDVSLEQYRGKVLLIVNVASKCGQTKQYAGLEKMYGKYKEQGLAILAFPANEFGGQEPGSDADILAFCTSKYNVSFDLFAKLAAKGDAQAPLYRFLSSEETNPRFAGPIKWNFTKFLIARDGQIVARFEPAVQPEDPALIAALEAELAKEPEMK